MADRRQISARRPRMPAGIPRRQTNRSKLAGRTRQGWGKCPSPFAQTGVHPRSIRKKVRSPMQTLFHTVLVAAPKPAGSDCSPASGPRRNGVRNVRYKLNVPADSTNRGPWPSGTVALRHSATKVPARRGRSGGGPASEIDCRSRTSSQSPLRGDHRTHTIVPTQAGIVRISHS